MSLSLLPTAAPNRSGYSAPSPAPLVARLGAALASRGVVYCQWKGHGKRERWANGRGDIDLLVDRTSWPDFTDVLSSLGFKLAQGPAGREATGVMHFFGLDSRRGDLIHIHAYQRLAIGAPWRTHYRIPLERELLASAELHDDAVFKTAAPELELVVLVLRLVLRHEMRDLVRREPPRWLDGALSELDRLEEQATPAQVAGVLTRLLPEITPRLFEHARATLLPGCPAWRRVWVRAQIARALRAHASRPPVFAAAERLWRRIRPRGQSFAGGGAVVALLGGDGSGKSTCADALTAWLEDAVATLHLHLGRPARSPVTFVVGGALKAAQRLRLPARVVDHLDLLRSVCTGRDRYRLYTRAFRFAADGGVVICERYPSRESWALSGPSETQGRALAAQSRFATALRRWERSLYERMVRPDLAFLLSLDPETAVRRKPSEPADYVRERARLTAATDWSQSGALVIDAAQPLPQVVATLKAELWKSL
jgi:thymidylate kinase